MAESKRDITEVVLDGITVKTVAVEYKRKANLGDYSSVDFGCTMWADLDQGVNPQDACDKLALLVKDNVRKQLLPIMRPKFAALEELAAKLPQGLRRLLLGLLADTTIETAIRVMSKFRKDGLVKTLRGGYVVIVDREALQRVGGE